MNFNVTALDDTRDARCIGVFRIERKRERERKRKRESKSRILVVQFYFHLVGWNSNRDKYECNVSYSKMSLLLSLIEALFYL